MNTYQADIWPEVVVAAKPSGRGAYWLAMICLSRSWVRQGWPA
ncbi:hypothetical protein BIFADO_01893 [Bifidobacterium adolescentis L2-32]|uniref:Uncharacterized protein n=1 Tax=Bifidobacterium adolescentis L2-32 TaxID=411481 RepID=A7A7Q3_BIFAD|nr:hypothetical protein BIFADO_01893 [Bifidobacterium adolescentis L2-32]